MVPADPPSNEEEQQRREHARAAYALRRKEAALAERARQYADLEEKARALEAKEREHGELASLDEWQLLQRIAQMRGIPEHELIKRGIARVANGGKPEPEHELQDTKTLAQKANERVEALEAQLRQEREEAALRSQREHELAMIRSYQESALSTLDAEKHPALSDYPRDVLANQVIRVANAYARKSGAVPDVADVLEYLENEEQKALRARLERHATRFGYAKGEQPSVAEALGGQAQPAPGKPGPVTNAAAAGRGNPPGGRGIDERDRRSAAAAVLRQKRKR